MKGYAHTNPAHTCITHVYNGFIHKHQRWDMTQMSSNWQMGKLTVVLPCSWISHSHKKWGATKSCNNMGENQMKSNIGDRSRAAKQSCLFWKSTFNSLRDMITIYSLLHDCPAHCDYNKCLRLCQKVQSCCSSFVKKYKINTNDFSFLSFQHTAM